MFIIYFIKFY